MLRSDQTDILGLRYRVFRFGGAHSGEDVATVRINWFATRGRIVLPQDDFRVRSRYWSRNYTLTRTASPDGPPVAVAEHVGRKEWTLTADGITHRFQRTSVWSQNQALLDSRGTSAPAGRIERTSAGTQHLAIDLPTLPLHVGVFATVATLCAWQRGGSLLPFVLFGGAAGGG